MRSHTGDQVRAGERRQAEYADCECYSGYSSVAVRNIALPALTNLTRTLPQGVGRLSF